MHVLVLWCDFVGTWLLVAGSIYQAYLLCSDDSSSRARTHDPFGRTPTLVAAQDVLSTLPYGKHSPSKCPTLGRLPL